MGAYDSAKLAKNDRLASGWTVPVLIESVFRLKDHQRFKKAGKRSSCIFRPTLQTINDPDMLRKGGRIYLQRQFNGQNGDFK